VLHLNKVSFQGKRHPGLQHLGADAASERKVLSGNGQANPGSILLNFFQNKSFLVKFKKIEF
jgi:hypothetical protein